MAYGSPSSPEDIRPYLEDIREGRPVSDAAVEELTERYRRIGGRSPLDEITERQRAALARAMVTGPRLLLADDEDLIRGALAALLELEAEHAAPRLWRA
jgi:protoheme ferro-lyase